jgi:hypothetical protein
MTAGMAENNDLCFKVDLYQRDRCEALQDFPSLGPYKGRHTFEKWSSFKATVPES